MDFETTKRLLDEGANPEKSFSEEYDTCWELVCSESFFIDEDILKEDNEEKDPFGEFMVEDLIGYAAYESMYNLLEPYIKNK